MKNILIKSLIVLSVLFLSSCGDDDETVQGYNPAIIGSWDLESITVDGTTFSPVDCDEQITWTFAPDGLGQSITYIDPVSGTNCQVDETTNFSFGMDNPNVFTVRIENSLYTYNYELTNLTLRISEGTIGTDETLTFTKQN